MEFMQFVSGAGAALLWGFAAIIACVLFKGAFNALGWITDRVLQLTGGGDGSNYSFTSRPGGLLRAREPRA
jgi:hypothetical protein